ncbi:helix-turn-helix domain-containing protein [Novosphingobium sp. NBM11]|uniref:helix-turn-helix domain-containing protein n=1 Tax=Novosphingobium sp. NBM11 TaxID=2596914 RepID=UPI001891FC1B|nr:helix-turn-helix domain-containing protein [Novosphingobium sp. NBM11]
MIRELLTEEQAAKSLGMSARTLRGIRSKGMIRYIRTSPRTIRYTPEDLDEYLAKQTTQDQPQCRSTSRRKASTGTMISSSKVSAITEALMLRRSATLRP